MAALELKVRGEGLIPGLWTAPFQVADRSWVYENHRDWLVHNAKGEPIRIGQVDGKDRLFVIDTTNPAAQEYLRKTYSTLVNDWNIGYVNWISWKTQPSRVSFTGPILPRSKPKELVCKSFDKPSENKCSSTRTGAQCSML